VKQLIGGAKPNLDHLDVYLSRRIIEVYMLRKGLSLASIKDMSEVEVSEYLAILNMFDELEQEQMNKRQG
jgi:hypothetical protein